jgi:carboxypeptidase C (cathepsin A)
LQSNGLGSPLTFFLTTTIDPAFDRKDTYYDFMKRYQNELMGYNPTSPYVAMNGAIIDNWDDEPDPALSPNGDRWLSSIPDMAFSMTLNPNLKVLVQHGYYDLNTPFYQSQLNITGAGLSIPVKLYEGGHGVSPFDTGSYDRLIQELHAFYDQPQGQTLAAMNASVTAKETP